MKGALVGPEQRFVEDSLASPVELREVSWPHGEAKVWAVKAGGQTVAFLKQHRQRAKFVAELRAYREIVPVLADAAPRLLGVHDADAPALLLSALPGTVAGEADWPADIEYDLHVRAARLLRRLHSLPVEEAARVEVEAQTRESLAKWIPRARAHLPPATIDWAIVEIEAGIAERPPICICHKDFSPRNWIATPDGQVGLIDFERACASYQYLDWSRLWMREWLRRPDLREAFFTGYGNIEANWEPTMRRLMTLPTVAGVVWAIEHDDAPFAEENRAILERLMRSCAGS